MAKKGGRKRNCSKGKSCGASCIERSDECLNGLSKLINAALASVREISLGQIRGAPKKAAASAGKAPNQVQVDKLIGALNLGPSGRMQVGRDLDALKQMAGERKKELWSEIVKKRRIGGAKAKAQEQVLLDEYNKLKDALRDPAAGNQQGPSVRTKGSKIKAKNFDDNFVGLRSVKGDRNDYDWEGSIKGSVFGGRGAFGTVLFNGGDVVKRGEVGVNEAEILKKVGALGLGPRLGFAEIGSKKETFGGVDVHFGRIVMSRVEGQSLGKFASATEQVGNSTVSDTYWKNRAKLHRAGIAHNDAHPGNFFIDGKGNGKFVDFGLAQDNAKAALSEALGGVIQKSMLPSGATVPRTIKVDFQAQAQRDNPNIGFARLRNKMPETLGKIADNVPKVENYLINTLGFSPTQAAQVMISGIRNPESFYSTGVWAKVSDSDAKKMIDLLYDGI